MTWRSLRSAEFVFPAHPDKLADGIADSIVEDAARRDRLARCSIEVGVYRQSVFVTGEILGRGAADVPVEKIAERVVRSAGFTEGDRPDPARLEIRSELDRADLARSGGGERFEAFDQTVVTGYALNLPATNYLPVEHWLANRLGRRLTRFFREAPDLHLGPDGKLVLAIEENRSRSSPRSPSGSASSAGARYRLSALSLSIQQLSPGNPVELHRRIRAVLRQTMESLGRSWPALRPDLPPSIRVNGAGRFDRGGTFGDNGLSGKKLVVDAYGPRIPIGGGALSGKDFFHVDRAGALHARRVARAVVLASGREREEARVCLSWFPGDRRGRIFSIETRSPGGRWIQAARDLVEVALGSNPWGPAGGRPTDLTLEAAGTSWTGTADLLEVARFGHFTDPGRPWEETARPPLTPPRRVPAGVGMR